MLKKKKDNPIIVPAKKKKMTKRRLAFIIFACAGPLLEWIVMYLYANGSSFFMAFQNSQGEFSLGNFVHLWEDLTNPNSIIREAIRNTLLSFVLGLIQFPFTVLVSYFIYKKIPGAALYRVLFFIPALLPGVAMGMIVVRMLGVNGVIAETVQSLLNLPMPPELLADSKYANITVLLHMLWLGIPGDLIIWGGTFSRIPTEVLESGQIDGVNWWQEFTRIIVPLVWPTVALKMVLSICGIFGATGSVFLLTEGEFGTMTLAAWQYIELLSGSGGNNPYVYNYLSTVGFCMTVIAVILSLSIRHMVDKVFADVEY